MRKAQYTEPAFIERCFLCQTPFQYGPHIYSGRPVKAWDVMACNRCLDANWDGIVPSRHPRLIAHLEERGVEIRLNAKGWIDWPK